jgi:putative ABC transport system permease protein
MSATVLARPPAVSGGGSPARRAVVRWAWRLFRREWRQQLLVLTLVTVAVAATILGAAVATNTPPPANAGFGTADHLVTLPGADRSLAADLATIGQAFGTIEVIESRSIDTGLVQGAQLRAQDPRGAYGRPMLALVSGRYPTGPGEVAMTGQLAATLGLGVGDRWQEAARAFRVVGLVENPQNLLDNFALVPPGQLDSPSQVTVLFDATAARAAAFDMPAGATVVVPQHSIGIPPAVVVFAIAIVGLVFVGLVAVAGFTVLAQRRLRGLGMLSSLGATDRNLRLVLVANGAVVGIVGALAGAVIGLAAWIAYAPHLATAAHHRVAWTDLPWWLVAATMVLAVATAVLASRHPARAVVRIPVVAALSRRPVPAKGVHRSAVPGVIALGGGVLLLLFSGGWGGGSGKDSLFQLLGLLACAAGLLLLAPLAITVLGAKAWRAPIAVRIALRDLARYRARSGAALAATSFAVFIAVLIALLATGRFVDPVDYFGPNLPPDQLIVYAPGSGPDGSEGTDGPAPKGREQSPASQESPAAQQAHAGAIAASLGSEDVLALDTAGVALVRSDGRGAHGAIYVATPTLLAHYGIDPSTIDPAATFVTSRPGLADTPGLQLLYGTDLRSPDSAPEESSDVRIQTVDRLPTDTSDPNLLITTTTVSRLKLQVSRAGWLIQAPRALSATQINAARRAAVAAGLTIESKSGAPSLAEVRDDATAVGILIALGVLGMTVGLVRGEAARDMRTLAAAGASGSRRRTITAATAGALGLLGAVLGTAVAYLATAAFFSSELTERMGHVPVLDLTLILLGLPAAAALGGWLFAGGEPAATAHQRIE